MWGVTMMNDARKIARIVRSPAYRVPRPSGIVCPFLSRERSAQGGRFEQRKRPRACIGLRRLRKEANETLQLVVAYRDHGVFACDTRAQDCLGIRRFIEPVA